MSPTADQVRAWRLRRHRLDAAAPREALLDVVAELCGIHAQLASSAELALLSRVEGLAPGDVDRVLWEKRALVKTWAIRGTLHLLPAREIGLWHAALGTYRHFLKPSWLRAFDITEQQLEDLIAAVGEALCDRVLTRAELADEVAAETGSEAFAERLRESWGAYLKPASFRGQLSSARRRGRTCASRIRRRGWAPATRSAPTPPSRSSRAATCRPTGRPRARTSGAGGASRPPRRAGC